MKKIAVILGAFLMALLMFQSPAQADDTRPLTGRQAAVEKVQPRALAVPGYKCANKTDRWTKVWDGGPYRHNLTMQYTVAYRVCYPTPLPSARSAFVEPNYSVVSYDYGHRLPCGRLDIDKWLNGVKANPRFWRPSTGANFNPGTFRAPCESTGNAAEIQQYDYADVPRLYQDRDGDWPKWAVLLTVDLRGNPDREFQHAQQFNPRS